MVEETMFKTKMQNSHKYTSLTLFCKVSLTRSLWPSQIGIPQDTENGCDVALVLFFRLPPNLDSGLTS